MNEIHDIATSVLDDDGSCRDLNFEGATWKGIHTLLEYALGSSTEREVTDGEGRIPSGTRASDLVMSVKNSGSIRLLLKNCEGALVRHLQVFVFREVNGTPFVELTFFPEDVAKVDDLRVAFLRWLQELCSMLGASRCYARYENASWAFGDTRHGSGVFLVV